MGVVMTQKVSRVGFLWAVVAAFALAALVGLAFADDAHAATWKKSGEDLKSGSTRIYYQCANPDALYNFEKATFKIYKKSKSGKAKLICKVKAYDVNLCGYYGKKLYYSVDATGSEAGSLYMYNEKSKKKKRVVKYGYNFQMKGKYLVGTPNSGAWGPMSLYSVNMATAKAKKITSTAGDYFVKGSKIYYLQSTKNLQSNGHFGFKVMKCNLSGSGKKAVSKLHYGTYFRFKNTRTVEYSYRTAIGNTIEDSFRF